MSNESHILVPRYRVLGKGFTKKEVLKSYEHPGRFTDPKKHGYQSPATWIDFLVGARKGIILCTFCRHKFDPKKHRYRRFYCVSRDGGDPYRVNGECEDCKEDVNRSPGGGTFFIPEEGYAQVCNEPGRRAGGRWNLKNAINNILGR